MSPPLTSLYLPPTIFSSVTQMVFLCLLLVLSSSTRLLNDVASPLLFLISSFHFALVLPSSRVSSRFQCPLQRRVSAVPVLFERLALMCVHIPAVVQSRDEGTSPTLLVCAYQYELLPRVGTDGSEVDSFCHQQYQAIKK